MDTREIVSGFVTQLNVDGEIGDARIVSANMDSDTEITVTVRSAHDVNNSGERDEYNNYKEFTRNYFSGSKWAEYIKLDKVAFSSKLSVINERMNEDYHDSIFVNSAHAIKHDIMIELKRYAITQASREGDEDTDSFVAQDVYINLNFKSIDYFPTTYIMSRYEEDHVNKYNRTSGSYLNDWVKNVEGLRRDNAWEIIRGETDGKSVTVTVKVHYPTMATTFKHEHDSMYTRSDYKKLVKGRLWAPNPDKIAAHWNDIFHEDVIESDQLQDLESVLNIEFGSYTDKLYRDEKITEADWNEMNNTRVKVKVHEINYFRGEDLAFTASEERNRRVRRR